MTDDIREAARQAAREAVARRHDIAQWAAAKIRSGDLDDEADVNDALTGADAAIAAAAPLIRAQCAEVAREWGIAFHADANDLDLACGDLDDAARLSGKAEAAEQIERAILALNEKETT